MRMNHVDFQYDDYRTNINSQDSFDYVQLAKHRNKDSDRKILLVLDYVPTEDLRNGQLLSGATKTLLQGIMRIRKDYYMEKTNLNNFNWLCVSFHSCKTRGKSADYVESVYKDFKRRLYHIISEYKPDTVITFGPDPFKALNGEYIHQYFDGKFYHFYGRPIETEIVYDKTPYKFDHFPTLSLHSLVNDMGKGSEMALAGYVSRNLNNALHGDLKYKIPKLDYTTVLVDTVELFDRMIKFVGKAKLVAIDTETENLNRRVNRMLTIQFATTTKRAFILPVYHKDSPFTPKELKYIQKRLKEFFEGKNSNELHIYANASFDLSVIRNNCGVRFFKNDVWDVFGGEYAFDENMKFLRALTGYWYYSLLNLSMQYGCNAYYEAEFGKDQRKTIATVDLNEALIEYCALDVIVPMHIIQLQHQRALDIKYKKYPDIVSKQISDMLHTFSTLEFNGAYTDLEYLFYLNSNESPIRKEIENVKEEMYKAKAVKRTNARLNSKKGVPAVGLLGKSSVQIFDIGKEEHTRMLFFDILKLKPTGYGKKIKGVSHPKLDKRFQKEYKDIPEVALFTKLKKSQKLFNAYVKAFIKQWGFDPDMRFDKRIRPHFEFLPVVTGRTSAQKPSLHQIPARSDLGKHIKRLFISEEGRIVIKVDYSAHEVRCWSIFTDDKKIAALFENGRKLRNKFKIWPDKDLAKRVSLEGDVHKINAAYFFGVAIEKVDKTIRAAVKGVIFGLIYQQGDKGLAESTGQTIEAIRNLAGRFRKRYPVGVGWFDEVKEKAKKFFCVESPLGRRRHTWGLIVPRDAKNGDECYARTQRQSVNSPIQGMGSDFLINGSRCVEQLKFKHWQDTGHYPDFYQANSVHDSISFSCAYGDFWLAINMIERGLTEEVAKVTKKRHGFDFVVPLEIDFEIGDNERDVEGWTYSIKQLSSILKKTLTVQKKERKHDINPKAIYKNVMYEQYDNMPDWAKKQMWNLGYDLDDYEDPRSDKEVMEIDFEEAA